MKFILDDILNDELKEYLLAQEGVIDVDFTAKDYITELNIKTGKKISPIIVYKHIQLFQNNDYSTLLGFDKGYTGNFKNMNYYVEDICCDYCYKGLIEELFENNNIKAVKSNYDFNRTSSDVNLEIEYNSDYKEKDLVKFLEEEI